MNNEGVFKYATCPWFAQSLNLLGNSGAYGVAIDVWVSVDLCTMAGQGRIHFIFLTQWGAVERGPGQYLWTGYKQLLETVKQTGLKLQVNMHL